MLVCMPRQVDGASSVSLGRAVTGGAGRCVAQTEAVLESARSPLPLHWTGGSRAHEACLLRMRLCTDGLGYLRTEGTDISGTAPR